MVLSLLLPEVVRADHRSFGLGVELKKNSGHFPTAVIIYLLLKFVRPSVMIARKIVW